MYNESMLNVLVLSGGDSPEREISLRSGAAVAAALEQRGHTVTTLDPAQTITDEDFRAHDVIFPVLHGVGGEDGILQERFERLGLNNFVGSGHDASALCFEKWGYKAKLAEDTSINTPDGVLTYHGNVQEQPLASGPFVLKPFDGGSSVDTFIVRDPEQADWPAMLDALQHRYTEMLLEELVEGTEITVGVLGEQALPVIEIIPPSDGEFDYENKYNGRTQELCPPLNVSSEKQTEAQALALKIHKLTGCRDMSRTDMIITPAGKIYVLETNTIPGMTDQSLLPKAAAVAGIDMPTLCNQLVQAAATRRTARV